MRLKHRKKRNTTTNDEKKNKNYSNNEEKVIIHTITYQNQRFSNPNVKFEFTKFTQSIWTWISGRKWVTGDSYEGHLLLWRQLRIRRDVRGSVREIDFSARCEKNNPVCCVRSSLWMLRLRAIWIYGRVQRRWSWKGKKHKSKGMHGFNFMTAKDKSEE